MATEKVNSAVAYFVSMGWTVPQSAGIVANLWTESQLNPEAVGDNGEAYGIAQWHPPRQAGFAGIIGHDIRGSTLEEQLAYVHAELRGTEKAAGDALSACTTAAEAGAVVSKLYERPADTEGEATRRGALAQTISEQYATPQATPAPANTGAPMPVIALLGLLAQFVPQIMTMIKPNSVSTAKDAALAQTVLNVATQAAGVLQPGQQAGASHVAAAVEKMQADPELVKKVQQAVVTHPDIMPILEVGGGVAAARQADYQVMTAPEPFWKSSAVFWVSIILVPMIYWYVGSSIVGGIIIPDAWPWYAQLPLKLFGLAWDSGAKVGLANLVVGLVLGGICGVYYGISVTQQKQQAQTPVTSGPQAQG